MRGRGIDFEHRFKTSRWAEDLLVKSLTDELGLITARYGISTIVPAGEELIYGQSEYKEPDLLVFKSALLNAKEKALLQDGSLDWQERVKLDKEGQLSDLLKKALVALEVEFSPYRAKEMKDRAWNPRTEERWNKRPLKNANPPVAPNIWVKLEDLSKLLAWERDFGIPIVVTHLFDQEGFAIALSKIEAFRERHDADPADRVRIQVTGGIFQKEQKYDRIDAQGASETKTVFIVTPAVATKIGDIEGVKVSTQLGLSTSMKYVSHVIFSDGEISISAQFVDFLGDLKKGSVPIGKPPIAGPGGMLPGIVAPSGNKDD